MPPLPTPSWRRLLAACALTPALAGAAAATAGAAELGGTVLHVARTGTPTVYLATADSTVERLRSSPALLKGVSRGRRVTVSTDGATIRHVDVAPGFAPEVTFPAEAERRGRGLRWKIASSLGLGSKAGDVVLRGARRVERSDVAHGEALELTWTLSRSNGAVTSVTVDVDGASATIPAPTPVPAPAPAPASAPAPAPAPPPQPAAAGAVKSVAVTGLARRQVYHSPQTPGYSSWAGAWLGPDARTLFTSFVQVTGTISPATMVGSLDWTGVTMTNEFLRSTDGGASWQRIRSDRFAGTPHALSAQATVGLRDGSILRRVNAEDQQAVGVPERGTAYIQRLAPGASTWSAPQYLMDPDRYTYQLTRMQHLSDGRLIASGNYWEVPAGTRSGRVALEKQGWLLMVSSDDGRTWKWALQEPPAGDRVPPNEWDVTELPSGDLLAVMRTYDPANRSDQFRRQARLTRSSAGWTMQKPQGTPFPHSGHPELLTTREGVVLHIATTGVHWTADGGRTWTPLGIRSSGYYPTSVQDADGTIHSISHRGGDNDFGERDQAILMDRFKLDVSR